MITLRTTAAVGILMATTLARADGPATAPSAQVDNPQYAAWARFKPGASVTLVSDTDAGGMGHVHLEVTQLLKAVTPDAVTLVHANKMTLNGKPQAGGPVTVQTIAARVATGAMRPIGTADVTAMGRAFTCHVYEATLPAPGGATHSTAYMNDGVPGGVVKLVTPIAKGVALTFVLGAMDAK